MYGSYLEGQLGSFKYKQYLAESESESERKRERERESEVLGLLRGRAKAREDRDQGFKAILVVIRSLFIGLK